MNPVSSLDELTPEIIGNGNVRFLYCLCICK